MQLSTGTVHQLPQAAHANNLNLYTISAAVAAALTPPAAAELESVLDALGEASAKDQGLSTVITTWSKLLESEHTVFLLCRPPTAASLPPSPAAAAGASAAGASAGPSNTTSATTVVAFMRVGTKHLFLYKGAEYNETDAQCCLDVYVDTDEQRKGIGASMFRLVCSALHLDHPGRLAFDRPSAKMVPFLAKNFNLSGEEAQPNKFLVFPCFWGGAAPGPLTPPSTSTAGEFDQ